MDWTGIDETKEKHWKEMSVWDHTGVLLSTIEDAGLLPLEIGHHKKGLHEAVTDRTARKNCHSLSFQRWTHLFEPKAEFQSVSRWIHIVLVIFSACFASGTAEFVDQIFNNYHYQLFCKCQKWKKYWPHQKTIEIVAYSFRNIDYPKYIWISTVLPYDDNKNSFKLSDDNVRLMPFISSKKILQV